MPRKTISSQEPTLAMWTCVAPSHSSSPAIPDQDSFSSHTGFRGLTAWVPVYLLPVLAYPIFKNNMIVGGWKGEANGELLGEEEGE